MSPKPKSKCPICGGICKSGKTTFTSEFGSGIVVVRNVPAHVCMQCGEDWIADKTAEILEAMVLQAKNSGRQIEVSDFGAKAS